MISYRRKKLWREDRIEMLIRILKQLSGLDAGKLTFESIF